MSSNASPSDYNSDSEGSLESQTSRPNRWHGAPSTWRGITRDERGLAATLDTLRNQDLSIHLFNVHSLKRKAKEFEEGKDPGPEISQLEDTKSFVPPKGWTSWPLPPEDVPRTGEEIGAEDELETFTVKKREKYWPSRELEEILTAVVLKQAKETFLGREAETELMHQKSMEDGIEMPIPIEEEPQFDGNSDELRSQSPTSGRQAAIDRSESPKSTRADSEARCLPDKPVELVNTIYRPVVSIDDDRSSQLLRPSIRHTLSKLDDVLIALHHARDTCLRYSKPDAGTDDEERTTNITSSANGAKRPVGRPRKQPTGRNDTDNPKPPSPTPSELLRPRKSYKGRPQHEYPQLEGETPQERLIRIARIQKKKLPSFAPPREPRRSPSPKAAKVSGSRYAGPRYSKEELRVRREKKLGVRDWSEVLGAAALVGFEPGVIERATQRCATLFGESMSMRTILETPFAESTDVVAVYQPELNPQFDEGISSEDSSSGESENEDPDVNHVAKSKSKVTAGPRCCPLPECNRHQAPFRDNYSLQRHLKKVHKITEPDDDTEEEFDIEIPSDEEMDGGVHIDGFLKPLKPSFILPSKSHKSKKVNTKRDLKNQIKNTVTRSGRSTGGRSDREEDMESEDSVDGMETDEVESDIENSPDSKSGSGNATSSGNE